MRVRLPSIRTIAQRRLRLRYALWDQIVKARKLVRRAVSLMHYESTTGTKLALLPSHLALSWAGATPDIDLP